MMHEDGVINKVEIGTRYTDYSDYTFMSSFIGFRKIMEPLPYTMYALAVL